MSEHQSEDMEREAEMIFADFRTDTSGCLPLLAAVPIADWELELMPWAEPAVSQRPEVGSGAMATLHYITEELLPAVSWLGPSSSLKFEIRNSKFEIQNSLSTLRSPLSTPVVLGGYSLGGLFALWAACQTNRFEAVAAGSPSLWAGDWPQYAATHPMLAKHVYLSLGDREERSRNKTFARVGDRIRNEHLRLQQQLGERNTTLVWEEGGHFADPAARMARAFVWCLKQLA